MEFCPECGSRLELRKVKVGDDYEVVLACCKCDYQKQGTKRVRPKANEIIKTPKKAVTVISKEDQKMTTLPTLKVECPKCGNNLILNPVHAMHKMRTHLPRIHLNPRKTVTWRFHPLSPHPTTIMFSAFSNFHKAIVPNDS